MAAHFNIDDPFQHSSRAAPLKPRVSQATTTTVASTISRAAKGAGNPKKPRRRQRTSGALGTAVCFCLAVKVVTSLTFSDVTLTLARDARMRPPGTESPSKRDKRDMNGERSTAQNGCCKRNHDACCVRTGSTPIGLCATMRMLMHGDITEMKTVSMTVR